MTTENGNTIRRNLGYLCTSPNTRKERDQEPNAQQKVRPYEDHAENQTSSGRRENAVTLQGIDVIYQQMKQRRYNQ